MGYLATITKDAAGYSTDNEKILAYLEGTIDKNQLGQKTAEKLERITQAKSWLLEHKTTHKVVKMMMEHYDISDATAYRDMKLMSLVFGPLMQVHKDMKRAIADKMIEEVWEQAKNKEDRRTMAMLIKNYITLHQLDREDADLPDLSGFDFQPIIMAVLPEQVGQNPPSEEEIMERVSDWFERNSQEAEIVGDES